MFPSSYSLAEIQRRIDEVQRFLSVTLSIANAHTVEFYTHDAWNRFVAVPPQEVLSNVGPRGDQRREPEHSAHGEYDIEIHIYQKHFIYMVNMNASL